MDPDGSGQPGVVARSSTLNFAAVFQGFLSGLLVLFVIYFKRQSLKVSRCCYRGNYNKISIIFFPRFSGQISHVEQ